MSLRTGEGSCVPSNQSHKSNSTSGATSQPGQRYELVDLRDIKFPEDGDVYCIHFYGHDGKRKWKTVGTDFKAAWAAVMTMRYFARKRNQQIQAGMNRVFGTPVAVSATA
jgi:hypothetical protein